MIKNIIECVINEINKLNGEMKYELTSVDDNVSKIKVVGKDTVVISDLNLIRSITINNSSIILNEDEKTTILSASMCVYL